MKKISDYKGKALVFTKQEDIVQNQFYTTLVTEMTVTKDDFHAIWPNLYPNKGLTNKIGHACGIEFLPNVKMETVYGDEIQTDEGTVRKPAGLRCWKQGKKRRPDGTWQISSPVPYEFNWNDRAELDFLADEEKPADKQKYKSRLEKRKHILELKKFASQRAGTGAELGVIRELTGMNTSFKEAELKANNWTLVFSQITESPALQAEKQKAVVDNIRNGGGIAQQIDESAGLLTGSETDSQSDFNSHFQRPEKSDEPKHEKFELPPVSDFFSSLESGDLTVQKAYEQIITHPDIQDFPNLDAAKQLVKDNGNGEDVMAHVLGVIKEGLKL